MGHGWYSKNACRHLCQIAKICLQTRHLLCLQTRHLLCQQTRHLLCQQTRHLWSPKTSQLHCQHGRTAAVFTTPLGCLGRPQIPCLLTQHMSWLQTQQMSWTQQMPRPLPADTTYVLPADNPGFLWTVQVSCGRIRKAATKIFGCLQENHAKCFWSARGSV